MKSIKALAPATVANVSCGFDIFGFAVEAPADEVLIERRHTSARRQSNHARREIEWWHERHALAQRPYRGERIRTRLCDLDDLRERLGDTADTADRVVALRIA